MKPQDTQPTLMELGIEELAPRLEMAMLSVPQIPPDANIPGCNITCGNCHPTCGMYI